MNCTCRMSLCLCNVCINPALCGAAPGVLMYSAILSLTALSYKRMYYIQEKIECIFVVSYLTCLIFANNCYSFCHPKLTPASSCSNSVVIATSILS